MRLNTVRLSGFKSFADQTQFTLPGQLVGVVGPNGCGKSNIMDAVRWVLGESKASELRGESMQDVIFNGSSGRKPAGRASVELVFGNESGRAGGSWGRYSEIAVRRVLTRDGASTYSINGQVVRRRDVQDVFLGTGLGPRAYAIIGQGTISRIIESRPDELRLFLEEAAGVSKYKERRRETEHKLRDARDNLVRVADIRRELGAQVDKLGAQAEVAVRYRSLQELARVRRHQLAYLQQQGAAAEAERLAADLNDSTTALEARTADLRRVEADLAVLHVSRGVAADALHAASGRSTEAALEVSRLEERVRQMADARRRLDDRKTATQAQRLLWIERLDAAQRELADASVEVTELDALATVTAVTAEGHTASLPALNDDLQVARQALNDSRAALQTVQQDLQVLSAESRQFAAQRQQLDVRRERLAAESCRWVPVDAAEVADHQRRFQSADAAANDAQRTQQQLADQAPALDERRRAAQVQLRDAEALAAGLVARRSALEALQARLQAANKQAPWLARHGIDASSPLWHRLRISAGWEAALEAVLRERMGAFRVASFDLLTLSGVINDPPPGKTVLYAVPDDGSDTTRPADSDPHAAPALVDLLDVDPALRLLLADWLGDVRCCDRLADALARRPGLVDGAMLVTRDGHLVGRWSVALHAADTEQSGLLARARDIVALASEAAAQQQQVADARSVLVVAEAACRDAAAALSDAGATTATARADAHRCQVELVRETQRAEQSRALGERLAAQVGEADADHDRILRDAEAGQQRAAALHARLDPLHLTHERSGVRLQAAERVLLEARDEQRRLERLAQEAAFAARSGSARVAECRRSVGAAEQQSGTVERLLRDVIDEAAQLDNAPVVDALHTASALRARCDVALAAARDAADLVARQWRDLDEARMRHQQALQPLQDTIGRIRLQLQAAQIAEAQSRELLEREQVDLLQLARSVQDDAVCAEDLPAEIDRLEAGATALGAVNLAAVDELADATERKGFVDDQCRDLESAMTTLEGAIQTIDLETRDLLSATFDQVNTYFGRLFPVLFGGGEARLSMTGAEILDAGVLVLAQPPGKKNSSIALLSGGEKALTAIALVFAIFHLNPAPFCLLDEVDAPLDDANTERYARLVRDMSAATQFLFISHNRIAMEMAGQLIGVTMQEQGVSRIVAVDVNSAIDLQVAS